MDTSSFQKEVLNVIWAPCGSGKTTAGIKKILPLASAPRRAIYLIDTRLGNERLAKHHAKELIMPSPFYAESIALSDLSWGEGMDKVCVTTYAQFGSWCLKYPRFEERFEHILCDEPQNLVNFSEIEKYRADEVDVNLHKIARAAICDAVKRGNVTVTGITATPKPLEKLRCRLYCVPIDRSNLRHFTEDKVIPYATLDSIVDEIKIGMRGGIYMTRITQMEEFEKVLRKRGHNPLMLWSLSNEDHPFSAEQLKARKYIIDNEAIPPEYDIFLFNATAETSINLNTPIDFFIAHNPNETTITQSRGRYRVDIDTLYVQDVRSVKPIPESYLNRPVDRTELKGLREYLGMKKDKDGHEISINDMVREFSNCGYNAEPCIWKRRKCFIIRKM